MTNVGVFVNIFVGQVVGFDPVGFLVAAAKPVIKVGCLVFGVGLAVGLAVGYTTGVLVIGAAVVMVGKPVWLIPVGLTVWGATVGDVDGLAVATVG